MKVNCDFDPDKSTICVEMYDMKIVKALAPNEAKRLHTAIRDADTKKAEFSKLDAKPK